VTATILVTGGAGYIGSITVVALLRAGYDVVVVDDFSNSAPTSLARIEQLTDRSCPHYEIDIRDRDALDDAFAAHAIDAVIHFAGLKAVGESVEQPLRYYDVNVGGTISLLDVMARHGVHHIVFSSSATVYGTPETLPIPEDAPLGAASPYGRTKLIIEDMLRDVSVSDRRWHVALLRYFNPAGAEQSGQLGEQPRGTPNNLLPFLMQVAVGLRPELVIFGDDYATSDGTCIRDYIHVVDLADGHVAALRALPELPGCHAINLGTGQGHSVLDVLRTACAVVGFDIPHRVGPRRPGDVPVTYADPARAHQLLGWRATRTLEQMCADAYRWHLATREDGGGDSGTAGGVVHAS
jgi:UDP-glucose 4-epimerase